MSPTTSAAADQVRLADDKKCFDHDTSPDSGSNSNTMDEKPNENSAVLDTASAVAEGASSARELVASAAEGVGGAAHGIFLRTSLRYPRLYHLVMKVFVPLLCLIGVSFLCGYFVARSESVHEKDNNDAFFAASFNFTADDLANLDDGRECVAELNVTERSFNKTEVEQHVDGCMQYWSALIQVDDRLDVLKTVPSFEWILCGDDRSWEGQAYHVLEGWIKSYLALTSTLTTEEGMSPAQAHEMALEAASGHGDCKIHVAGGAAFWFTVMTTIGYGNDAPGTTQSRAMVYTLGFASILLFGAVISQAGNITIVVFDDLAIRRGAPWLTRGVAAPLFWLVTLWLWLFVLAGMSLGFAIHRPPTVDEVSSYDLAEALWFVYISITTIGFGDFYIEHEMFRTGDMFYLPFLFLLGFVFMANFLRKFSQLIIDTVPRAAGPSLEEILESTREPVPGGTTTGKVSSQADNHVE